MFPFVCLCLHCLTWGRRRVKCRCARLWSRHSGCTVAAMRWQELFSDLEHQAWSLERSDLDAEVVDRTRAEVARLSLLGRLRAAEGSEVRLGLRGGRSLQGQVDQVGADWVLVTCPGEHVVPAHALATVDGLSVASVAAAGASPVSARLPLLVALRALAVDRATARFQLVDGRAVVGTPDRVGADFVDVAVHDPGEAPRLSSVRGRTTISAAAIDVVVRDTAAWA